MHIQYFHFLFAIFTSIAVIYIKVLSLKQKKNLFPVLLYVPYHLRFSTMDRAWGCACSTITTNTELLQEQGF